MCGSSRHWMRRPRSCEKLGCESGVLSLTRRTWRGASPPAPDHQPPAKEANQWLLISLSTFWRASQSYRRRLTMYCPTWWPVPWGRWCAAGGAGKSMLALQLAAQIAGGPDLLDVGELPTGPVIYLPAEDPPAAIHHRLHALGAHLTAEQRQAVADGLLIQP
ncbi:AAA family ATPase, partial [Escherichia coli]|uniref:AAA family ATPase n=1 Tax=Escherichia coli TaxID=562 RepID=UPI0032D98E15